MNEVNTFDRVTTTNTNYGNTVVINRFNNILMNLFRESTGMGGLIYHDSPSKTPPKNTKIILLLPLNKISAKYNCCICLASFNDKKYVKCTTCVDCYCCTKCSLINFQQDTTCPVCRSEIDITFIEKIIDL